MICLLFILGLLLCLVWDFICWYYPRWDFDE
jgi:hypothetical protein